MITSTHSYRTLVNMNMKELIVRMRLSNQYDKNGLYISMHSLQFYLIRLFHVDGTLKFSRFYHHGLRHDGIFLVIETDGMEVRYSICHNTAQAA